MKTKYIILGVVIFIVAGVYVYEFPYKKGNSEKAVSEYMKKQEVDNSDIKSIEYTKNYKQGGYFVDVIFKSMPNLRYEYNYGPGDKDKNFIVLTVYKDNEEINSGEENFIKYRELK